MKQWLASILPIVVLSCLHRICRIFYRKRAELRAAHGKARAKHWPTELNQPAVNFVVAIAKTVACISLDTDQPLVVSYMFVCERCNHCPPASYTFLVQFAFICISCTLSMDGKKKRYQHPFEYYFELYGSDFISRVDRITVSVTIHINWCLFGGIGVVARRWSRVVVSLYWMTREGTSMKKYINWQRFCQNIHSIGILRLSITFGFNNCNVVIE